MNSLLQYLLNVSFSILPFYLLYLLCFRRFTFFNWNRWYILGSLVISALIPLISFRSDTYQYLPVQNLPFIPQQGASPVIQTVSAAPQTGNWLQLIMIIYAGGVLATAASLLASLFRILKMIYYIPSKHERIHGYQIIKNDRVTMNASFFGYIFLQPSLGAEEAFTVIMHEDVHARRRHTLDILLLECFKILLWFHPALYHYKKLLQQAHEFEVDKETALVTDKKTYAHMLLKIQCACTSPIINGYSSSGIPQRIKMLFAKRSKASMKILYLLVIPCLVITSVYCSKKTTDIQASLTEVTHGEFGVFEENEKELRYVLYPEKIKRLEDYHTFLYKGELQKIGERFEKYKASIEAITYSQTTGPTKECGFIVYGKGNVSATFDIATLLKENMAIECVVDKSTGKVYVRSLKPGPIAGTGNDGKVAALTAGQKLFTANCAACHKVEKDMTGPALTGIENRRSREWIYHFTRNNAALLQAGDSTALKVYNDWGKIPMNSFPNLSNKDIDAILAYIRAVENGWQDAAKN